MHRLIAGFPEASSDAVLAVGHHFDISLSLGHRVLAAGRALFCEKPLTVDLAEGRALVTAGSSGPAMVNSDTRCLRTVSRSSPALRRTRSINRWYACSA